ncbi:AAA family ATPase [Helicobacter pametensis]|uniref:AAA family ATPase n=1 Tax=Helicobacter pametensis TaxID=95149 RepID=UPI00047F214A|nr:AAA family ATPase [Helicobacter pametensis]
MKPKTKLILGFSLGLVFAALMAFLFLRDYSQNITQEEFNALLANASKFETDENYLYFWNQNKEYKLLKDDQVLAQVKEKYPIQTRSNWLFISICVIVFALLVALIFYFFYQKNKKSFSTPIQSSPHITNKQESISPSQPDPKITLDSLAGISKIKTDLLEIIDYLKNPKKYSSLGLRMPKGVLLVGPPGVGKTKLAKALASQSGVPFFYQSGSSFAQIFVGSGAKKVQELFLQAKKCKHAVIFIDEIDSVGKIRGHGRSDERESTLNQLLTEMDGFLDSSNIIVFGATNNPEVLDPALLRSGRFDRKIYIDLPTLQERIEIFNLYLKQKDFNCSIKELAKDCAGFSGAMIENLINEAGLLMLRNGRSILTLDDFKEAKQTLIFSLKKFPSLNQEQREILALYQSAKALYAHKYNIAFEKVALWEEESIYYLQDFMSKTQILQTLKFYLCGNEALKLFKQEPYNCAKDDLAKAKMITREFLEHNGMGTSLFDQNPEPIIAQAQEELITFLTQSQEALHKLSNLMLAQEHLTPKDCDALL